MKRNHLLFLAALFLVTALKYAFAQEDMSGIGWEPTMVYNPMNDVLRVMVWAPIVGLTSDRIFAGINAAHGPPSA